MNVNKLGIRYIQAHITGNMLYSFEFIKNFLYNKYR